MNNSKPRVDARSVKINNHHSHFPANLKNKSQWAFQFGIKLCEKSYNLLKY